MSRLLAPLLAVIVAAFLPASVRAAQSYDNCTAYIDSVPAVIGTQGTWCLRHDLSTAMASGFAIDIQANNVTIDCNHFKIGGLAAGIHTQAGGIHTLSRLNATIRNCTVRGFQYGVRLESDGGGGGHLVEDNLLDQNTYAGLWLRGDSGSLVRRNRINDTGGLPFAGVAWGMNLANADVIDNTVANVVGAGGNVHAFGIALSGAGLEVRNNIVRSLTPAGTGTAIGIQTNGDVHIVGNTVSVGLATPVVGSGISTISGAPKAVCRDNMVTGFPTVSISVDCLDGGGNVVQ